MMHFSSPRRPRSWAEIDASALLTNARTLKQHAQAGLIAVVKADAYGHGLSFAVPALQREADLFAVANLQEAFAVRALAPDHPILLLGPAAPGERAEVVAHGFIPMVSSVDEASAYSLLSRSRVAPIHLKLDTGMGRVGLWYEQAVSAVREIRALHGVQITGLASHLPSADEDVAFTRQQLERFTAIARQLREEEGLYRARVHVCNSAGTLQFPQYAGDLIRPGIALFGFSPIPALQPKLRAALTWKTQVTLVREVPAGRSVSYGRTYTTTRSSRLATLAVGYADGYRRNLSGKAEVQIRGRRCPVLGRVTMDQIVVDVTDLPGCEAGEEVILLGSDLPAAELAEWAGTIAWEILTGIGPRVERLAKEAL